MDPTIFVGLDVHKKTIAVATVEARASANVRFSGTIPNTPDAIRSMLRKLGKGGQRLHLAHEAGPPPGYNLYLLATGLGPRCDVVAPSAIPRKAGDKVKVARRVAMMFAQLLRAGQLTAVWVPDEAHEAMRDLVRNRASLSAGAARYTFTMADFHRLPTAGLPTHPPLTDRAQEPTGAPSTSLEGVIHHINCCQTLCLGANFHRLITCD